MSFEEHVSGFCYFGLLIWTKAVKEKMTSRIVLLSYHPVRTVNLAHQDWIRVSQKAQNIPKVKIELSHPNLPLCRLKLFKNQNENFEPCSPLPPGL